MESKDILLITRAIYPLHGFGGMERHCHDFAKAMSGRNWRVHVVTMPPDDQSRFSEFNSSVFFYFVDGIPARSVFQRITSYPEWVERVSDFVKNLCARVPFAVVYGHGLAAGAAPNEMPPLVYNPHGMEEFKTSGLKYLAYSRFRSLSRQTARRAKAIIATDASLVGEAKSLLEADEARIVMIPNAVFLVSGHTATKLRSDWELADSDPVVLAVGRLEFNKGYDLLLDALTRIKLPDRFKLVIAGTGSQEADLRSRAGTSGLAKRVLFTGIISEPDLASLYAASDLFIHPTRYEGSSIVTLEAMSHGLPVIATKTGGLPDKVLPGTNGWLAEPGDAQSLARTIEEAVNGRSRWQSMGAESLRIVRERFSWDVVAPQFENLFSRLY